MDLVYCILKEFAEYVIVSEYVNFIVSHSELYSDCFSTVKRIHSVALVF